MFILLHIYLLRVELRRGSLHSDADATSRHVLEAYTVRQRSLIISERRDPVESVCKLWRHHSFTFFTFPTCLRVENGQQLLERRDGEDADRAVEAA